MKISVNKLLVQSGGKKIIQEIFDNIVKFTGRSNIRKKLLDVIDEVVEDTLNDVALPVIRQNLVDNESKFSGDLYENLDFVIAEPGRVVLEAGPASGYAALVERGSEPRSISDTEFHKLIDWVIFKKNVDADAAISIAGRVAITIETHGNIEHPYIQPAMEATLPTLKSMVTRRLKQELS